MAFSVYRGQVANPVPDRRSLVATENVNGGATEMDAKGQREASHSTDIYSRVTDRMIEAIASGNPAVLTLAEADAELQRLTLLKKNHLDEQYLARRSVRDLPAMIAGLSERLSKLTADETTAKTHAADSIAIGGRTYRREDIPESLGGKLDGLPKSVREPTRIPVGTYRGLRFGIELHSPFCLTSISKAQQRARRRCRGNIKGCVPS
jgi:hypothetical protein